MNKTYRFGYAIPMLDGDYKWFKLSRSIPRRSAYKVFFRKSQATKGMFLVTAPDNLLYGKEGGKRYCFYYRHDYVQIQNHLWKLNHGKFKTLKKGEITDDYRYACRRDCGC